MSASSLAVTQGDSFSSKTLISTGLANNPQGLMPLARTPRSRRLAYSGDHQTLKASCRSSG